MTIYIDIILLINFIIDLLLLLSVSLLLKRRASLTRIIISSSIGSLSTLLLFVIHNNFLLLIYKLLSSSCNVCKRLFNDCKSISFTSVPRYFIYEWLSLLSYDLLCSSNNLFTMSSMNQKLY